MSDPLGNTPGGSNVPTEQTNLSAKQLSAAIYSALSAIHKNIAYDYAFFAGGSTPDNRMPAFGGIDQYTHSPAASINKAYGLTTAQSFYFVKAYRNYYNNFATIAQWFKSDGSGGKAVEGLFKAMQQLSADKQYQLANSFISDFVAKNENWQQLSKAGFAFGNILSLYGGMELEVGAGIKGGFKATVGSAPTKMGNLVKIGDIDRDVMTFSAKIGDETVDGITNFTVKDGKLYLDKLHLEGSAAGKIGRESLWDIAKDLGKQYKVEEVIIQGGRRTTGKYKGQIPSPVTIKVN